MGDPRSFLGASSPDQVDGFEDMAFLFDCQNANRWIIRMNLDEAAELWRWAHTSPGDIVEIGRLFGGSTYLLAAAAKPRAVYSIDVDPRDDKSLRNHLDRSRLFNVSLLHGDSCADWGIAIVGGAFIDGEHSYDGVKRDFEFWYDHVAPGGWMAFHDMLQDPTAANGSSRFFRDLCEDPRVVLRSHVGSLAVFTKSRKQ